MAHTLFPEEGSKPLVPQPREGQDVFNLTYVCDCDALWWCVGLMPLDKDLSRAKGTPPPSLPFLPSSLPFLPFPSLPPLPSSNPPPLSLSAGVVALCSLLSLGGLPLLPYVCWRPSAVSPPLSLLFMGACLLGALALTLLGVVKVRQRAFVCMGDSHRTTQHTMA